MKIGIIGSGFVGSATAFQLVMSGTAHEVVLIDKDTARAEAEAIDIFQATPNGYNNRIFAGNYEDLQGADIVIFTAGANQKPGQSRMDLLRINAGIMEEIVPQVIKYASSAIFLVASNPADVMTEIVLKFSKLDTSRVICSGTVLDSARFRTELAKFLGISSESISGYVVGEHGDSEVLLWSEANVGIMNVFTFAKSMGKEISPEVMMSIDDNVRNAAYKIIEGKRATFYGIAGALTKICRSIAMDANIILPVSSHHKVIEGVENVTLAMPTILGRKGIVRVLYPSLSEEEHALLKRSATLISENTQQILAEIH